MTLTRTTRVALAAAAIAISTGSLASSDYISASSLDSLPQDTLAKDTAKAAADTTKAAKPKKKELTPYEKVLKDSGSVVSGLVTVRHIKDNWYWEIPDSVMGRHMLCVTRFTAVPQSFKKFSGEEVNHSTIYLEQRGEKAILVREYIQQTFAPDGDRISQTLKASTTDPIVAKLEVIGKNPKTGDQLVNVTKFLQADTKLTGFTTDGKKLVELGAPQPDRSFLDTIKTYPINIEVSTTRTYAVTTGRTPAARSGFATVGLNTSIVLLPRVPMQMRLADERVGYFQNRIARMADDVKGTDHDAIVMRYRLEPADPKAYKAGRLSKPKKQIVYYIDPATPPKWVPYLKAGVDDWNKAFEQAGFRDAIVAKEWPNDPTMSMEDARFSMIRYLPAEIENAYGPRIVDPRSGEIIEAHVCWYHNVMNLVRKWYMTQCGPLDPKVKSMDLPDDLLGELIRFVSSHEVGHSLGLRHNMIASSATPVEKLRDKAWVEKYGHTASIMDYARFNYVAQPEDHIGHRGLYPRINDYDKWAIEWGYQWRPEFQDPYKEKEKLRAEVTKRLTGNKRLRYIGDEGRGEDPRSQTEDLGDNAMTASDYGIKNLHRVVSKLEQWTRQPDGQYDDLDYLFKATLQQYQRYVGHVSRNVGGTFRNNWPAERGFEPVSRQQTQQAISWLGRQLFTAPLWLYPTSITQRLGTDVIADIRTRQQSVVSKLLSPATLQTMSQRADETGYSLEQYLSDVADQVWQPLTADDERGNTLRRLLQRHYVQLLDKMLNPSEKALADKGAAAYSSDATLYVARHLDTLQQRIATLAASAQGINADHYKSMTKQINRMRNKYNKEEE